ncbi:MAG: hypothetical protein A2W91_07295 [Bacteroidetes bacterium GWF2_38_335]|nr:MAG: hypothetical protein A2W91_07295 [Bacteroidetes bacterium GWF2_38_335]OFY77133.1 MAG: hypothetical protein A2281_14530 [Bacteroidetes bacterium RIFOXYA12_FULL_38_20]HBS85024.1 hypothetical protein [Bacteroidales bacterium]
MFICLDVYLFLFVFFVPKMKFSGMHDFSRHSFCSPGVTLRCTPGCYMASPLGLVYGGEGGFFLFLLFFACGVFFVLFVSFVFLALVYLEESIHESGLNNNSRR